MFAPVDGPGVGQVRLQVGDRPLHSAAIIEQLLPTISYLYQSLTVKPVYSKPRPLWQECSQAAPTNPQE